MVGFRKHLVQGLWSRSCSVMTTCNLPMLTLTCETCLAVIALRPSGAGTEPPKAVAQAFGPKTVQLK